MRSSYACHLLFWDGLAFCCSWLSSFVLKGVFLLKIFPTAKWTMWFLCLFLFSPRASASKHGLALLCFATLEQQLVLPEKALSPRCFISVCAVYMPLRGRLEHGKLWLVCILLLRWLPGRCLCSKHPSWSSLLRESLGCCSAATSPPPGCSVQVCSWQHLSANWYGLVGEAQSDTELGSTPNRWLRCAV